tara:strand:+ start:1049 stop:3130 length:2082 start_codon:yes stop_codon:yes gene_type:complete
MVFGIQQQINMANWTVTNSSIATSQGATVSANVVLTITPNVGYTISASDFKIGEATETSTNVWSGGNVDIGINTVTFADTGVAGTPSNTVTATVAFDSFTMPSSDKELFIDIDEKAPVVNEDRPFCIRTKHMSEVNDEGVLKHEVTYATAPTGVTTTNNNPTTHNLKNGEVEHLHQGAVTEGVSSPGSLIFSVDFDANETYGYYYTAEPTIATLSGPYANYYTFQFSNHVYNSNNDLIFVTIKGYYDPPVGVTGLDPDPGSTSDQMCELGQSIDIIHNLRQDALEVPGSAPQVTDLIVDQSVISQSGETRSVDVIGDATGQCVVKVVSSDSNKTYTFTVSDGGGGSGISGSFTAAATDTGSITFGTVGNPQFFVNFPAVSSTTYYDFIVTPTSPTTATNNVPTAANELRVYQYPTVNVTLGLSDGGNTFTDADLLNGTPNTAIVITGPGGRNLNGFDSQDPIVKDFSYTILPAMLSSGTTLNVKGTLDFSLDNNIRVTKTDGIPSGTSFDVDSTSGIIAGATINWSVQKQVLFAGEFTTITVGNYVAGDPTNQLVVEPSATDVVPGMIVTSSTINSRDGITVTEVDQGQGAVTLSQRITVRQFDIITFTARGITVSSVTDSNTLVASQTMLGTSDNLELTFGGQESDVTASVSGVTVTKVSNDIIIAGQFQVSSFPTSNTSVSLDLNNLITVS